MTCYYISRYLATCTCLVRVHLSLDLTYTYTPTMSTDKELYKLELLSLVSRVSQELFNHTKLQDKNLAEFVIAVSTFPLSRLVY